MAFLGHIVGQGQVKTVTTKVESIAHFPTPSNKKELMHFLGMAGYYRKVCGNFSVIAEPLAALLKKNEKFKWSEACEQAFRKVQVILMISPVLVAPTFEQQFKLYVDASDVGVGGVLMQQDIREVDHPICYFSKKFNKHQKMYSTIEKECVALILALAHFYVYLCIQCFTDHNPLTFIAKIKKKTRELSYEGWLCRNII